MVEIIDLRQPFQLSDRDRDHECKNKTSKQIPKVVDKGSQKIKDSNKDSSKPSSEK
jgi:hypothetical protein